MSDRPFASVPAHGAPVRAVQAVLRWFELPERSTLRLLIFGVLIAALGTLLLSLAHPAPWVIQSGRLNNLQWTLAALDRGDPILTMVAPGSSQLLAAGASDDQGLYLIVPWLTHYLGWQDPLNLLRWMALVAFAVPIAIYPWLIRQLSGSTVAGLASPFLLLIGLCLLPLADIYWVGAWTILALLPVVLLLDRRWPRHGLLVLLGLLVLASVASSIRGQAGLPVLVGAFLVLVRRPWPAWARVGAVMLCVVAYLSVNSFGMAAVRAERHQQLDGRVLAGENGISHPFWHTAYVGLGYLPNKWDIRYQDPIGWRDALRIDPHVNSTGPTYNRILRDRYVKLIGDDPGFAVRDYGAKVLVALRPATIALFGLAIVGPWLLLVNARRSRWRRDALFVGIAGVLGLASPFLATPFSAYLLGWLAAVLLAAILAFSAVIADGPAALAYARSLRGSDLVRGPRSAVGRSVAVALLTLAVVVAVAPGIERKALRWNAKPAPHVVPPKGPLH